MPLPRAIAAWTAAAGRAAGQPDEPPVLGAAAALSTASPPVAIAAVTTLGYLGSFTGPPLVGALAA